MKIEILHIDECPNWREAGRRVRAAADALGLRDASIEYHLLHDSAEAALVPFAGSPTILVDGTDAFPTDATISELACRIYPTDPGLAGLPTLDQLLQALGSCAS